MEPRKYDLTSAGRYRTLHKMRISDRLYQRVIAEDIKYKNGKILLKKGTLIGKEELDKFKIAVENQELDIDWEILENDSPNRNKILKNQCLKIEHINVYVDNNKQGFNDEWTPIIGEISNDEKLINCYTLSLVDFIACISYTINL